MSEVERTVHDLRDAIKRALFIYSLSLVGGASTDTPLIDVYACHRCGVLGCGGICVLCDAKIGGAP